MVVKKCKGDYLLFSDAYQMFKLLLTEGIQQKECPTEQYGLSVELRCKTVRKSVYM